MYGHHHQATAGQNNNVAVVLINLESFPKSHLYFIYTTSVAAAQDAIPWQTMHCPVH